MTVDVERPFDAPWQARAFAMVVNLHQRGFFTWEEWARQLAASIAAAPERAYYESWLEALQAIAVERRALTSQSIDEMQADWVAAAARTPHGMPIELEARGTSIRSADGAEPVDELPCAPAGTSAASRTEMMASTGSA